MMAGMHTERGGATMRTGVIGLGAMGAPMARNLHQAGYLEAVWNRTVRTGGAVCLGRR